MHIARAFMVISAVIFSCECFASPDDINASFIYAAKSAKQSVVSITIYEKRKEGKNTNLIKAAYGSGTIIEGGYIVTNYHVVIKGDYYQVVYDDMFLELEKFGNGLFFLADPKTDIALMKIKDADRLPLKPVVFEDSSKLAEGEWVLAVGNPYGLSRTITSGVVSSTGRDNIGFTDIEDFIQTDVPINPGNSGGPLINLHGKVIGINTAIRSESGGFQGISFSIPSNLVVQVCRELIEHGRVRRGWIGFLVREHIRHSSPYNHYLKIISVIKGSPAESAGLRIGDIIRDVDGEKISTLGSLIRAVGNKTVGSKINLSIARNGRVDDVNLVLREKDVYEKIKKGLSNLFNLYGIEVDENSETGSVVISSLSPKSLAYNLKKGDTILALDGKKVASLDAFVRMFDRRGFRITKLKISRDSRLIDIKFEDE